MLRPRLKSTLAMIALAIAAMLSTAGAASACSTSDVSESTPRACCNTAPRFSCGCCKADAKASTPSLPLLAPTPVDVADGSCACRAELPPAPVDRPAAPSNVSTDHARFVDLPTTSLDVPAVVVRESATVHDRDSATPPLYLRTARLRF